MFSIRLSTTSLQTVRVNCATANATAVAPGDYPASPTTTLSFAPGQLSRTVAVPLVNDLTAEDIEQFFLNLSDPYNATIGDGRGVGRIFDND